MNNSPLLSRLINYSVLVAFLAACISFGFYFYAAQKSPRGYVSEAFSRNMLFANAVSDEEIRYYNGNAFVAINLSNQKTKLLSQYKMIPDVTQVFWLEHGAVFATSEVTSLSDLQPIVTQVLANDPDSRYGTFPTYWYLSFTDNTMKPISTNVSQPEMFGTVMSNGSFIFKDDAQTYSILEKSGEIQYGVVDLGVETRPVYATDNSLVYAVMEGQEGDEEGNKEPTVQMKKVAFYQQETETISEDLFEDGVSNMHGQVYALDETHFLVARALGVGKTGSDLYIYDTKADKKRRIAKGFEGLINHSGKVVLATKQGRTVDTVHRITKDGVAERLRLAKDDHTYITGVVDFKGAFVVTNSNGTAQLASKDKATRESVKEPVYDGALEKEISNLPEGVSLSRNIESPYDTSYSLSFNGKSRDAINALQAAMTSKGYDPNQFTITLAPGRSAEF